MFCLSLCLQLLMWESAGARGEWGATALCYLFFGDLQGRGRWLLGPPSVLRMRVTPLAQRWEETVPVDHSSLQKDRDGEAMRRGLGALLWCQGHRAGAGFQGTPLTLREASCAPRKQTVRDRMGTAHPQGDLCQVAPRMVVGESSSWCSIGHVQCEPLVAHAETSTQQSGLQLWQLAMCQEVQPPPNRGAVGYSLVLYDHSPDELQG